MSQLYLYSNIWIYIWSIFSQVGQYFTYLIYTVNWWSVCGNYLSCDPESYSPQLWGQGGALKRGIIQTVRFAYQNMAGRLYTPFHLDYQWNCSWLAPDTVWANITLAARQTPARVGWSGRAPDIAERIGRRLAGAASWVCRLSVSLGKLFAARDTQNIKIKGR